MQQLQTIAQSMGSGAAEAQAWLSVLGEPYDEPVILPVLSKRAKPHATHRSAFIWTPLSVFPNPANGPVYLTYTIVEGVEAAQVELHNAQGQLVRAISLGGASGIAEIQAEQLTPGIHIATLYFDGVAVGSTKVNVVR